MSAVLARAIPALVLGLAACGGRVAPVAPQDRGHVHLVRCRAAPPLPKLDEAAESNVLGSLLTGDGTIEGGFGGLLGGDPVPGAGSGFGAPGKPAIAVVLGAPSITGSLAAPVIQRVLQHRVADLKACAAKQDQLLASGPAVSKAIVAWRFTISPAGRVIQADVTSHVLSSTLAACVTAVLRGAAFPEAPDGRVVSVTLPIAFDGTGTAEPPPEADAVAPWTPFALDASEAANVTDPAARAAEGALRGRLGAIDACFASSPVTGSLRAMLAVDSDGSLTSVRAGGLGDKAIEACVENAVTGMRVMLPSETSGELACDLSRGDAQPWRVTVDRAGYGLVEVSRTRVRYGDQTVSAPEDADTLLGHSIYVLVADPDAPGAMLALAMRWTADADATLVAVRAGPAGATPQLLGAGHTGATGGQSDDAVLPTLEVGAGMLTACASRWRHVVKLAEPAALDGAAQKLAARCRSLGCSASLVIAVDRDAVAKDLVDVAGAARRAGFERVLLMRGIGGAPVRGGVDGEEVGAGCAAKSERSDEE